MLAGGTVLLVFSLLLVPRPLPLVLVVLTLLRMKLPLINVSLRNQFRLLQFLLAREQA